MRRLVSMVTILMVAAIAVISGAAPSSGQDNSPDLSAPAGKRHTGVRLASNLSPAMVEVVVGEPSSALREAFVKAAFVESRSKFLKPDMAGGAYFDSVVVERGWLYAGLVLDDSTFASTHTDSFAVLRRAVIKDREQGVERFFVTVGSVDGTEYQRENTYRQWTLGAIRGQRAAITGGLDLFIASPYSVAHEKVNDSTVRGAYVFQVRLVHVPYKLAAPPSPPAQIIQVAADKGCNLAISPLVGYAGLSSPVGDFNGPIGGAEIDLALRTQKADSLGNGERWVRVFLFGAGGRTGESPYDDQFEIWGGGIRFPGVSHVGESLLTLDLGVLAVGAEKLPPGDSYVAQANGIGPMVSLGLNTTGHGVFHLGIRATGGLLRINYDSVDHPDRDYSWEPYFQAAITMPFNCTNK